MPPQELLGERLRALEPGCRAARPEAGEAGSRKGIDDARDERSLGTDDRHIDMLTACQLHQGREVLGGDGYIAHPGLRRSAGVAWRHQHFTHARSGGAFPGERMLTAAAADDQNFHGKATLQRRGRRESILERLNAGNAVCR